MIARRIIFFGLFAAAAARLMYSGDPIYLYITLIMVAVLVIGIINIVLTVCLLRIRPVLKSPTCERGDTTELKIHVACPASFQPAYILAGYRDVEDILNGRTRSADISFSGGRAGELTFPVFCKYRGIYDVGICRLEIRDLFGLLRFRLPKSALIKESCPPLTVLPAADMSAKIPFDRDYNDFESVLRSWLDDLSSVAQVRDWRPGDPLRRIHWKLSARFGSAQIKEFDKISSQSVTVYADFSAHGLKNEPAAELEDRLTAAAASFCGVSLRQNISLRLVACGSEGVTLENLTPDDFQPLRVLLAGVRFDGENELSDIIEADLHHGGSTGGLAVITSSPSDKLAELLIARGITHADTLVCFAESASIKEDSDSPESSFLAKLRANNIPVLVISGGATEVTDA